MRQTITLILPDPRPADLPEHIKLDPVLARSLLAGLRVFLSESLARPADTFEEAPPPLLSEPDP